MLPGSHFLSVLLLLFLLHSLLLLWVLLTACAWRAWQLAKALLERATGVQTPAMCVHAGVTLAHSTSSPRWRVYGDCTCVHVFTYA